MTVNPNYMLGWFWYGSTLAFSGESDASIDAVDHAIALSPLDPAKGLLLTAKAVAAFVARRHEEGVAFGRQAIAEAPEFLGTHRMTAANLSELGRLDEARREVAEVLRIFPDATVAQMRDNVPYRDEEVLERYCAALARAGLPVE